MGYCSYGYCHCGRCRRPGSPQPYSVLLLLLVALTLLSLSSFIKFDIAVETGPQVGTLLLLVIALLLLFLVCWLSPVDSCRRTYYCGCWICCHWKVRC